MAASSSRWKHFLAKDSFKNAMASSPKPTPKSKTRTTTFQDEKDGEYKLQFLVLEQKREIRELKRAVEDGQNEVELHKEKLQLLSSQLNGNVKDGGKIVDQNDVEYYVISKVTQEQDVANMKELQKLWVYSQKECVKSKEKISELEGELATLKNTVSTQEERIVELEYDLKNSQTSEQALKGILAKQKQDFEIERKKFEQNIQELKETVQKRDESMVTLTLKYNDLKINHEELTAEHTKLKDTEKDLNEEIEDKKSVITKLKANNVELIGTLEETKKKLEDLTMEKDEHKNRYEQLDETHQKFIADSNKRRQKLKTDLENANSEIKSLKFKVEKLEWNLNKPKWK